MRRVWGSCVAAACLALVVLAACNSGGGGAPKREPADLGKEIAETYLKMIDEVGVAMAATPDPAALHPQVDALKTKYIDAFVVLGRQRQALAPTDREKCDNVAQTRMRQVSTDILDAMDELAASCKETDAELAQHFAELRRLTRYASFDQLKTQLPDEAARLGIK